MEPVTMRVLLEQVEIHFNTTISAEMMYHIIHRFLFVRQANGSITVKRFEPWIRDVLIAYVADQRRRLGSAGWAILMLDG
jgi:hypothetical protein